MNRALVIGSLSKVRASKLTTLAGAGAACRVAITPMARPPDTAAAIASTGHQRRAGVPSMVVAIPDEGDDSDIASNANAISLED